MKILVFKHVPFEGPGNILNWANENGHKILQHPVYQSADFPSSEPWDFLIILGGPMGVYDDAQYPWIKSELEFIARALKEKKPVLGICLGAQLLANALGARVYKNKTKEVGWFPIEKTGRGKAFLKFPDKFDAFHWHGDTFDLPKGAVHLARTEACINQAFEYEDVAVGLQFHLECLPENIEKLVQNCPADLKDPGKFVQKESVIREASKKYALTSGKLLYQFLDSFASRFTARRESVP